MQDKQKRHQDSRQQEIRCFHRCSLGGCGHFRKALIFLAPENTPLHKQSMTLHEFIEKHSLVLMKTTEPIPATFIMTKGDDPRRAADDKYEIYSNGDASLWVSVNRTLNYFRVCYADFAMICSDWLDVSRDYAPLPLKVAQ